MIRRPPRSTLDRSSAASDVYRRQDGGQVWEAWQAGKAAEIRDYCETDVINTYLVYNLSLIHISEPTRPY